jgi:hypothetical protein
MLIRNWRYGVLVAVAVLSLAASNGCCCRTKKGFVLRGDWSLEYNRIPHMQSNGPTYSCDCGAPCGTPCGCADGFQNGAGSGGYEVLDGSGYPGGAGGGGPHGAGGRGAGGHGAGGYGGEGGAPAPPMPTPAAQTRFHPIPTRPAFEPHGLAIDDQSAQPAPVAPLAPATSGRRGGSRLSATRSGRTAAVASPIRRTSAEIEVEPTDAGGQGLTTDYDGYSAAAPQLLPAAPAVEPAPKTSTWRVKTRQS